MGFFDFFSFFGPCINELVIKDMELRVGEK